MAKGRSTRRSGYTFSQVPSANIQRSSFNRSCGLKTTFDASWLIPIYCDEALPGDTFNMRMSAFCRLATPVYPIMDNMVLSTFFFAVAVRLLWDNWQKFNGEQVDPGDSTDFLVPRMTNQVGGFGEQSIHDYMGLPTKVQAVDANVLHHRAYNLIWNEWFRDENLQDSVTVNRDNGPDDYTDYTLLKRGKRHDYFTSCLPWPQKGTAVELPLGETAPVQSAGDGIPVFDLGSGVGNNLSANPAWNAQGNAHFQGGTALPAGTTDAVWNDPKLEVDLSSATAATINQIRQAFQIQRIYERDARGGSRYTEILRSHFGVVSPDSRLQRPEYLGGGSSPIRMNAVPQTSETSGTPLGTLAAYGVGSFDGHGFTKSFVEHCVIIGLVCATADITYQQGLPRMFSRQTRWDYYWPALAHLGEQAVLNQEIYVSGDSNDIETFGYQERYAEYRYKPSQLTGRMRSNAGASLDPWHLAEEFGSLPVLNAAFIEDKTYITLDRAIATPAEPHFIFDGYFDLKCARPMPLYSVPGMIDHF